jgi:hypothetical protein
MVEVPDQFCFSETINEALSFSNLGSNLNYFRKIEGNNQRPKNSNK